MTKLIYFISDAHLSCDPPPVERIKVDKLCSFLGSIKASARSLFIVGDLFDFWFGWRKGIPKKYFRVLCQLASLSRAGVSVHYVPGNHDFYLADFLRLEIGILTQSDPLDVTLNGQRFFISHGDGLDPEDWGYQLNRRIMQHPVSIALFKHLHPDWGMKLAEVISRISRRHTTYQNFQDDLKFFRLARVQFEQGFDCVVLGHTHRPFEKRVGKKVYLNLGDWMTHFSYGQLDGGQLSLKWW